MSDVASTPSTVTQPRRVERLVSGQPTSDGAGVKLTRVLTQDLQRRLDPFLMLDSFATDDPKDYGAGFPSHPHRGFETISYMLTGRMRHQDSHGGQGLISDGGVQWMTAGRGVIHSEMPEQVDGRMEGFQLWLNLAAKDKLRTPWYRDIQSAEIPEFTTPEGVAVRVISGASHGVAGAMARPASEFPTDPLYLDLHWPAGGAAFQQQLPASHNAFLYVYRGSLDVLGADGQPTTVPAGKMAILDNAGDGVRLQGSATAVPTGGNSAVPAGSNGAAPARALLIAGQPLREPIAQYGPFVMNTRDELMQAVQDFNTGRLVS